MTERADESTAMTEEADGEELPLAEQLAAEQARAAELRENWQRERADFINYRRRVESERADLIPLANAALLTKILPVLDDFDLALANIPAKTKATTWVDGVMLIQRKLLKLLEGEGVTPIEALGQSFDPHLHEAVVVDEDAKEPHAVVAELRRGYKLRDKVLRPTLVRVGNQTKQ